MINEGLKILDENKAQRASDIDIVWLYGYGWPRSTGGLMYYGDQIGAQRVLEIMKTLSMEDETIKISRLLIECSQNNAKFLDIVTDGLIAT